MSENNHNSDVAEKPPFESRLAVYRVKVNFIAPFKKCKYVYVEPRLLKSKNSFLRYLENLVSSWPNGAFYLKLSSNQVFARFDVLNGKIVRFYEKSPITNKPYPIWLYWKNKG
ncbi:MAG: hypothetical protein QW625_00080 [Candidatus Nanoarchaeia archaeon]